MGSFQISIFINQSEPRGRGFGLSSFAIENSVDGAI